MFRLIKYVKNLFVKCVKKYFGRWAIHVETIHEDRIFKKIKKQLSKKPLCFIITPVNYDYIKGITGTTLRKKELETILKERYNFLKKYAQLELHVHLTVLCDMNHREQWKMITDAYKWFEKVLGFKPTKFVPGWWLYDNNTEMICKKLGLKLVKEYDYFSIHDFEL
jgi:hypothetical protein